MSYIYIFIRVILFFEQIPAIGVWISPDGHQTMLVIAIWVIYREKRVLGHEWGDSQMISTSDEVTIGGKWLHDWPENHYLR